MLLQAANISKHYGTNSILENISLRINKHDRIGLVGVNGAGKSTFLRILAGEIAPTQGYIHNPHHIKLGYLSQDNSLDCNRTILEELNLAFTPLLEQERKLREWEEKIADPTQKKHTKQYEILLTQYADLHEKFKANGGYEIKNKIRRILVGMGFADFSENTPIRSLSGGQRTRLSLARLLLEKPTLLLLDEPTNHLDIQTLSWLEQYLRSYEGAMLIVSHDRYFLDATVTTIVEIEHHQATHYAGNYSYYQKRKNMLFNQQLKQYEAQRKEIKQTEQFIAKNIARASTTKRAQSRRKVLEKTERLDKPISLRSVNFSFSAKYSSGKDVLQVRKCSICLAKETGILFHNISFDIKRGEHVAILGPNGVGKTTLLRVLMQKLCFQSGKIEWGTGVSRGYYDQDQLELSPNNTILNEVWDPYPNLSETEVRTVLGHFLFSKEETNKVICNLSGGEKARVSLAKLMLLKANVLLLDEPTNHLDLTSREMLEKTLQAYDGTLIFVSHDRYFLNQIADRIIELHPERVESYLGNYDNMIEKKQQLHAATVLSPPSHANFSENGSSSAKEYQQKKNSKRTERIRSRKLVALEEQIKHLEQKIKDLHEEMATSQIATDYIRLSEKQQLLEQAEEKLLMAYALWEETST